MLKPTIFREYDIRGIADAELLSPDVEQLGRGLGTYLRRHSGGERSISAAIAGSVPRACAMRWSKACSPPAATSPISALFPTPVLYYSAQHLKPTAPS